MTCDTGSAHLLYFSSLVPTMCEKSDNILLKWWEMKHKNLYTYVNRQIISAKNGEIC